MTVQQFATEANEYLRRHPDNERLRGLIPLHYLRIALLLPQATFDRLLGEAVAQGLIQAAERDVRESFPWLPEHPHNRGLCVGPVSL